MDKAKATLAQSIADGRVGDLFCCGLEQWRPPPGRVYDCVWLQWVVGHFTDDDFVRWLVTTGRYLRHNTGVIVVKDNVVRGRRFIFDTEDWSVVRQRHR